MTEFAAMQHEIGQIGVESALSDFLHQDFIIQGLTKAKLATRTRSLPSGRQSELRIPKRWLGSNKRHSRSCPLEQPVLWASGFVRCEIPEPDSASVRGHV